MAEIWTMGEVIVEIMRPEAGSDLKTAGLFRGPFPSGAPAIFIDTAARLGHSTGLIGGVGQDDFGKCLLERLERDGVDCSKVRVDAGGTTGVAFVTYFEDGSRQFIYHIGNTPAVTAKAPTADELKGVKIFHVMGCSLMAEPNFANEIIKTMKIVKSLGGKISFDPNVRKELLGDSSVMSVVNEVFSNTNILMPGIDELLMLTEEETVESAVDKCFKNESIEFIVLKKGANGCSVYTRDDYYEKAVYKVAVVDPTGAGDSFDAAFICGYLENKPVPEIIDMATAAGAINTAAFGPMEGDISRENLDRMIFSGQE